jgi:hypothetical protein
MPKTKISDEESSARVWASVEQVIASHGLSRNVLYELINERVIRAKLIQIPGSRGLGRRLVDVRSVEAFINSSDTFAPAKVMGRMRKLARASVASRHVAKLNRARGKRGAR